jgi:hypothetical protein
MDEKQNTAEAE